MEENGKKKGSRRLLRISLRTLLVLVTLCTLFLGFSRWRRQRIIGLYEHFPELGVVVQIPSDYSDYLWQRRPISAEVHLKGSRWGWDRLDVEPYDLGELHGKLRRSGVDDIRHFVDVAGNTPEVIPQEDMDGIDWSKPNAIDIQEERIFGKNWKRHKVDDYLREAKCDSASEHF